jgi:hypothetical protein
MGWRRRRGDEVAQLAAEGGEGSGVAQIDGEVEGADVEGDAVALVVCNAAQRRGAGLRVEQADAGDAVAGGVAVELLEVIV